MKHINIILFACILLLVAGCQNKNTAIEEAKEKLNDLCTDAFFGSGMPRVSIVVYDYINDEFYMLDGFPYNYRLEGIKKGRLVVRRYQDKDEEYGTVKFENETIIFIAD